MADYPDYQGYPVWRGGPLILEKAASFPAGTTTYGPFTMQNFASLDIHCYVSGGPWSLKVIYYLDGTYAQQLSVKTFAAAGEGDVTVRLGVLSSFFEVEAVNHTASALSTDLVVTPDNTPTPEANYQGAVSGNPIAILETQTIAAGDNATNTSFQAYEGLCYWTISEDNGPHWAANLDYWDDTGQAWVTIFTANSTVYGKGASIPVALPSSQCRITVFNTGTSSDYFLSALLPASG